MSKQDSGLLHSVILIIANSFNLRSVNTFKLHLECTLFICTRVFQQTDNGMNKSTRKNDQFPYSTEKKHIWHFHRQLSWQCCTTFPSQQQNEFARGTSKIVRMVKHWSMTKKTCVYENETTQKGDQHQDRNSRLRKMSHGRTWEVSEEEELWEDGDTGFVVRPL
jgi:hypothetical protein